MDWIAIRKEYESTNKTLKAVAEKHGIKIGTIKSRKSREGWEKDATLKKDATNIKKVATSKKDVTQNQPEEKAVLEITLDNFLDDSGLTEKQRLFCLYYVRSFNATQSAINAGYSPISAHVEGSRLLKNDKVAMHIRELKKSMASGLFIEAMDVLNKYIKIAFSDITDFLTFGQQQVPVMEEDKPVFDEHGRVMMQEVNYVDFKESSLVDGTIISEVKQGRNGVSIKLEDRMKALEKLELYFDLFPDPFKRRIEEERLNLSKKKSEQDERIVQLREEEARTKGW
jgi:phage terminase small subunit